MVFLILEGCDDVYYFVDYFLKNVLIIVILLNLCIIVYIFFYYGMFGFFLIDD